MTAEEIKKGKLTLESLVRHWAAMPKSGAAAVYRVVHAGTGEDALKTGGQLLKKNPTSTSVSIDWSRVGPGKTCCKIIIKNATDDTRPVDTRAVSTYTHEGEILLPPGTTFKKTGVEGDYTKFEAMMPGDIGGMGTDLLSGQAFR